MKVINKTLLIAACMLSFSVYAAPANNASTTDQALIPTTNPSAPNISGNYQCQGYDPYGKSNYSNPVTVTKNGDTYGFQWLSSKGYPFILGTGVFNSDVNNVVSVVFWDPKKPDYFGTEIFKIKADGSMQANWTLQAENQVGTEVCSKK